jgi:nicotinamide-nucleotide amidase
MEEGPAGRIDTEQMTAEIISVGTELLLGQIVNTNAAFLGTELASLGLNLYHITTVGDNLGRATAAIRAALDRAEVILITGGIGPTPDDVTREAIAAALEEELVFHEELAQELREFFAARNRPMVDLNLRQAYLPASARAIPNPLGTAPGILAEKDGRVVIALPGVPYEMQRMFQEHVRPYLRQRSPTSSLLRSRVVRTFGLGESALVAEIADLLEGQTNPTLAPLVRRGEVTLRLTARASDEAEAERLLDALEAQLRERLGPYIFGIDEQGLEQEVGRLLTAQGSTLAVAESCTGGLIGDRLTNVPGSSNYFLGGVIAYSDAIKRDLLGVPAETLRTWGAVSAETAQAMAQGVRQRFGADWGVAATGIAGPAGGTPEKPVGLVYVAVAGNQGALACQEYRWTGPREEIKYRTSQAALDLVRRSLLRGPT